MRVDVRFKTAAPVATPRIHRVMSDFDIGIGDREIVVWDEFDVEPAVGRIILATGNSGGGKTTLLREVASAIPDAVWLDTPDDVDTTKAIIDEIGGDDYPKAALALNYAGLGDAWLFCRRFSQLSDGQRYRYLLARTIMHNKGKVILADEFCATLDRITARVISYNLRRAILDGSPYGFVLATTHQDIAEDLQPDVMLVKGAQDAVEVRTCTPEKKSPPFGEA